MIMKLYRKMIFLVIAMALISFIPKSAYAHAEEDDIGRHETVFDTEADEGMFVIRFFKLISTGDEKSGDCALLISPDGLSMLIDAAETSCAPQVIGYLKELGITRLDYIMASHPHIDHIGGIPAIIKNFEVGEIYSSKLEYPTSTFNEFIKTAEREDITITYLERGDVFNFGEYISCEVFNPEPDIEYYDKYPENSTQFVNDRSLVVKFTYDEISALFTGDIYAIQEKALVDEYGDRLDADILKAPHHGANTSNSATLINTVTPQVAVMCHEQLADLGRYKAYLKRDVDLFLTSLTGCVRIATDGKEVNVVSDFDRPEF